MFLQRIGENFVLRSFIIMYAYSISDIVNVVKSRKINLVDAHINVREDLLDKGVDGRWEDIIECALR